METIKLTNKLIWESDVPEEVVMANIPTYNEMMFQDFKSAVQSRTTEETLRKIFDAMLDDARNKI